jgi:alpha-ketoglutarate-dependent taurine dioxygenase
MSACLATSTTSALHIEPLTGTIGAEVHGIRLSADMTDTSLREIRDALFTYGAIGFRNQSWNRDDQIAFSKRFGDLEVHPIVNGMSGHPEIVKMHKPAAVDATFGVGWHTDNTFFERPSLGSIVYAEIVPPVGGDTLFANQQAAYDGLSSGMKEMLNGMIAIHSAKDAYTSKTALEKYGSNGPISYRHSKSVEAEVEHPVVISHPVTGRKALFVNPMFTLGVKDMKEEESDPILQYLFHHAVREDYQCRFRWKPGSVAMWDNRIVMHAALNDYKGHERLLYRSTINGDQLS